LVFAEHNQNFSRLCQLHSCHLPEKYSWQTLLEIVDTLPDLSGQIEIIPQQPPDCNHNHPQ